MEDEERMQLERLIEELDSYRGRHTELITVYVPAGYSIILSAKQVDSEAGTASNIKSKSTRENVIEALGKISRHLRQFKQTPKNGLAVFCGNISKDEGKPDIKLWSIEPPSPINMKTYRCDQKFVVDPLKELLETQEVYGLIVMDRREATIGVLEGKHIRKLKHMTSAVPGKMKAGGQCLHPDTLLMTSSGDIIQIKDSHNPLIIVSENFNKETIEETPIIAKWENKKPLFKMTTSYPRMEIKSSADHTFFVRTENGIEEKPLSEIKEGDFLVMPEKINLELEDQIIDFKPKIEHKTMKQVVLPAKITPELAKVFGYYLGDGGHETDRLTFFEQRKEVAESYKLLLENLFGLEVKYSFRASKNYHQLRIYSRLVTQFFKSVFPEKDKTSNEKIPPVILKSSDRVLASFISGLFDAEGSISLSSGRISLSMNNEVLVRQLQLALLRLGIISSLSSYDNKRNPYSKNLRYIVSIDDTESLKKFFDLVGFTSFEKQDKINQLISKRSNRNKVRQLVVNGKEVARIIRNSGLDTTRFMCPDFFINKKQLSKQVFKARILDKISDESLRKRLEMFYGSNLIAVKISKIEKLGEEITIDIETKNHNFIANGLVVHNSAQRFERLTEGLALAFYRKVGEAVKEQFSEMKKLKGILVGGPGPTKESFLSEGQIPTPIKNKIIGVKDISYTDEYGLHVLVELSQDILAAQEITHEKEVLKTFFTTLGKDPDKVAYGYAEVKKALSAGAADKLYLSKELDKAKMDELREIAASMGTDVIFISTQTDEGVQFKNLGGIGALLRFAFK